MQCLSAVQCSQVQEGCDCLTKKICMLGKLISGTSYNAVGCQFSGNESIYIVNNVT